MLPVKERCQVRSIHKDLGIARQLDVRVQWSCFVRDMEEYAKFRTPLGDPTDFATDLIDSRGADKSVAQVIKDKAALQTAIDPSEEAPSEEQLVAIIIRHPALTGVIAMHALDADLPADA